MKVLPNLIFIAFACFVSSGCVTITESVPVNRADGAVKLSATRNLPDKKFLPEQSAVVPGSNYVMVQAGGGSVFLGPVLGSLNIEAKTKAMAEKYRDSYLGIDPVPVAFEALSKVGINTEGGKATYLISPFVFVQKCYDEKFRVSLVYHVNGAGASEPWVGRYTYHLPTAISVSKFGNPSQEQLSMYRSEMIEGADVLAGLLERDLKGELPAVGRKVAFGSLYIIGNKLGGLGMYQMPEELYFENVQLIEETDNYVTVRMRGNMHATGLFGGMAFGVHRINKSLVHTLKPM